MKKLKKHTINYIVLLFSYLPISTLYSFLTLVRKINSLFFKYRNNTIIKNIENSFKNESHNEISKRFSIHFFNLIAEIIKSLSISKKDLLNRVEILNINEIERQIKNKKNIVFVTNHFCNWEWLFLRLSLINDIFLFGIYQQQSSKVFEFIINKSRSRFGGNLISTNNLKNFLLKKTQRKTLFFVSDQLPPKNNRGLKVSFLGQSTVFNKIPERVSRLTNSVVFYIEMLEVKKGYYTVEFKQVKSTNITKIYANLLEETVRKQPEKWLWSHKRWKR
tara:strand:- start:103 stop:930 length:828 start_codon:yes stop_codon:yes gene_type:complete